jgi:hypothetical protein
MENSTAEAIRKLQEKASDLEAKLGEKEAAIATHLNEKEAMATALQEAELQRQTLTLKNEVLRLEMETKERLHQEKIDAHDCAAHAGYARALRTKDRTFCRC